MGERRPCILCQYKLRRGGVKSGRGEVGEEDVRLQRVLRGRYLGGREDDEQGRISLHTFVLRPQRTVGSEVGHIGLNLRLSRLFVCS